MCVGIASVAREGVSYLQSAVGSVLEGLSATEREALYLIVFIAHTNPAEHPAYLQPWLHALADRVFLYDPDALDIDHVRGLETPEEKSGAHEKGLLDYTYLLKECGSINTSYTVMLEDDVVLMGGITGLNTRWRPSNNRPSKRERTFLGWNSEEWPIYLFSSLLAISGVVATTTAIRHCLPATTTYLPNETIALLSVVITPLLIILFFAAGQATTLPIPAGVHLMPNFGCCSQGLVFPQARINDLVSWYESKRAGYVDMLTEDYADQNGETRWALTPCVLQHVGSKSSKTNSPSRHKNQRTASETIWNFRFKEHDVESLRREHELQKEAEEGLHV
ncbi:hypothetical protein CFD26_104222 [Aspergillus turcosus]|uniref:Uncharacterized protein n=1 Tax=Aspergillus turcosus TaxID=1245748 RepID=A0A3R7HSH4_9EURO|nr:hypothetical protein CFD26_104222 [Aspergillus turcosus]